MRVFKTVDIMISDMKMATLTKELLFFGAFYRGFGRVKHNLQGGIIFFTEPYQCLEYKNLSDSTRLYTNRERAYNCDRSGLGKLMSAGDFHFLIVQKGDGGSRASNKDRPLSFFTRSDRHKQVS